MTTIIRSALCVLAIAAPACMALQAAESKPSPTTGKVLVLDNERTLEGDIERVGGQYRVRRSVGELWIQAENALRLCATREEAYAFLRSRANLRDPDEHLRLAHWCHRQGLRRQALEEVTAAVELRPHHAESRRLLRSLERAAAITPSAEPAKPREQAEPAQNPQPPELSTESLSLFNARVQPILMNACASCHATGRGGAFKLTRTYESGLAGRKLTQQNLAAVLAQVNKDRPPASPLLTKAVSVHGKPGEMAQPPLKSREMAAYRSLDEWVRVTLENNPQLQAKASVALGPPLITERVIAPESAAPKPEAGPAGPNLRHQPQAGNGVNPESKPSPSREARDVTPPSAGPASAEPVDPFDPVIFNRQMHPQQKPDSGKRP